MIPSVRSRLWASAASFLLGFALANYGLLAIERPDQWLWLGAAVLLMGTGAIGVMVADTPRPVSIWSILGIELFAIFVVIPLLWAFTVAVAPAEAVPQNLWPQAVSWSAFDDVLGSDVWRRAAATSALVAALATVVAMPLAAGAAFGLVRSRPRGARWIYGLFGAALVIPIVAFATPLADQLLAFDRYDTRLALVPPALVLALPLAVWLLVTVFRDAPWSLRDAMRADGATARQAVRRFAVPYLGPGVLVASFIVFVACCQDAVLGAALTADGADRPLPATLLLLNGTVDRADATVATVGLLWMLPPLILALVFPRRISHLLGRSYR